MIYPQSETCFRWALVLSQRPLIPTFAGYGMTEAGPGTHMSPRSKQKPGSVGIVLPNTECKVSDYKVTQIHSANWTDLVARDFQRKLFHYPIDEVIARNIQGWLFHYDMHEITKKISSLISYYRDLRQCCTGCCTATRWCLKWDWSYFWGNVVPSPLVVQQCSEMSWRCPLHAIKYGCILLYHHLVWRWF